MRFVVPLNHSQFPGVYLKGMQLKTHLVSLILLFQLIVPSQAWASTNKPVLVNAIGQKKVWEDMSEQERIKALVDAIDQKKIRKNAKVKVIDEMFGTDFRLHLPKRSNETRYAEIKPRGNRWIFDFLLTTKGTIDKYSLTNSDFKFMRSEDEMPPREAFAKLSMRYRNAKSESEKLWVFLDAMNDGIIYYGMPLSSMAELLGQEEWSYERRCSGKVYQVPLSEAKDCWRIYFRSGKWNVTDYGVTNIPVHDVSEKRHD